MGFSVVEFGYDRRQVDFCLDELAVRLSRLAARAEGAGGTGREWDRIRLEVAGVCDLIERRRAPLGPAAPGRPPLGEAAELLTRARAELEAAREAARHVREQVYADAVRARRDLEAALADRRGRQDRADEILTALLRESVAVDTPTAAASVPPGERGTRAA